MSTPRVLTPYERTQLARYAPGVNQSTIPHNIPIEYVTGKVEFGGVVLSITPEALIPRIETEELVHRAQEELERFVSQAQPAQTLRIGDIGTGCGAVIVTLAHRFAHQPHYRAGQPPRAAPHLTQAGSRPPRAALPPAQVAPHPAGASHQPHYANTPASVRCHWLACDISPTALALAQQNAREILGNDQPIQFLVSDLLTQVSTDPPFDLLIANLPYIPHDRLAFLDQSVTDYEPPLALDGGSDGLGLIRLFLQQALAFTKPGSVILLEIDYTHDTSAFNEFRPDWHVLVETDSFTRNRFARLERK